MPEQKPLIVIKFGTHSITLSHNSKLNFIAIKDMARQIKQLHEYYHIIVVSSGAVAAGRYLYNNRSFSCKHPFNSIEERQVMATVGQQSFIDTYQEAYHDHGFLIGAGLLTKLDFHNQQHRKQSVKTLNNLLDEDHILPLLNENDMTAIDELKYGDNDALAADVAIHMEAYRLIYVTHTDGIYTANPEVDSDATLIQNLSDMDQLQDCGSKSTNGSGGGKSKAENALRANAEGTVVNIVNVDQPNVLLRIMNGERLGTRVNSV